MVADDIADWLGRLGAALDRRDAAAVAGLFAGECFWRDMVAFTWAIRTVEGRDGIARMLSAQLDHVRPRGWRIDGPVTAHPEGWSEAWLRFETTVGEGRAHVRLVDGQCWTLLTTLTALTQHPWQVGTRRPIGAPMAMVRGKRTWTEQADARRASIGKTIDPDVVIVGAGQGGLALAARLKQLGVAALIVEKNARAGDSWRNRYPSLCLHDPVWYDHMPFLPFPPDWPVFTPKDRMADFLEAYQKLLDLDCWTKSRVTRATFDDGPKLWTITLEREDRETTLRAPHLVIATGMSGYPDVPDFNGRETFAGPQVHSSRYAGGKEFAGQRVVVIGANTSAHDNAADLWEHDCDVTMVQRSGTLVAKTPTVVEHLLAPLYSEAALARGIDTESADFIATTWPHRLVERRMRAVCAAMRAADQDLHERLGHVGFKLDFGPDETGLALKSIREGGGFYIDVGASELICNGDIKLVSGVGIAGLERDTVRLDDGRRLRADAIVYATGYRSMTEFVADIVGREVAERIGKVWGVGSGTRKDPGPWRGELLNMWMPTAQEALWFQGGNLAQSRHFSRFLALQLKARLAGVPVQVYAA